MGHAVVSAKRVYTPPSVISIESIIKCHKTIALMKKFTLSKAIRNDLLLITGSQLSRMLSVTPKKGMKAGFPLCLKRKNPAVLTAGL